MYVSNPYSSRFIVHPVSSPTTSTATTRSPPAATKRSWLRNTFHRHIENVQYVEEIIAERQPQCRADRSQPDAVPEVGRSERVEKATDGGGGADSEQVWTLSARGGSDSAGRLRN